jgi:hypothetical protein
MPFSTDLWGVYSPPLIWVHLEEPRTPEDDSRVLVIRIKEAGRRSVSASTTVSRYSPEDSVFRAIAETLKSLAVMQKGVKADELKPLLLQHVERWVEPF